MKADMHPCLWCVLNLGEIDSAKEADLQQELVRQRSRKRNKESGFRVI